MTLRSSLRSTALLLAVLSCAAAGPAATSASAGSAPSTWNGLSSRFGVNGLVDLDTRVPGSGVTNVSGDIAQLGDVQYVSRTETTSTGTSVVVEALDSAGARVAAFGTGGRLVLTDSSRTTRAVALERSVRDQLLVVTQRGGPAPALVVTRLQAPTGALDAAFGAGGVLTVPGIWDGTSVSVGAAGELVLGSNDVGGPSARGVVLAFTPEGRTDLSFGGGDGRVDSPLGVGVLRERVADVSISGGLVVGGTVDGSGIVALFDEHGMPDTTAGDRQRRQVGERVDAVAAYATRVVVASVSGMTAHLSRHGRAGGVDGQTTVVVDRGCAVAFPDVEQEGAGPTHVLVDDGCGRGARVQQYDREDPRPLPRADVAPELDRLRPVVARRLSGTCVLGERIGDVTGATVACLTRSTGTTFVPLAPARVLDTRTGLGAPRAPLAGGRQLVLDLTGVGGVPATGVSSVTLNLTAVRPTTNGYLSVFPSGTTRPAASTLNTSRGVVTPSHVTAKLGDDGKVVIFSNAGSMDVVADVAGYSREGNDARFTSTAPRRVLDTRNGTGARSGRVPSGGGVRLDLAAAGVPAGAEAVTLNVTAVTPSAAGVITAHPGGSRPLASHLNTRAGVTVANLVTVKLAPDRSVVLSNAGGTVHLVADLAGWYDFASDDHFVPLAPLRLLDTRSGVGGVPAAALSAGRSVSFQVADAGGVPAGATAVMLTLVAVAPTSGTHLTAYPSTTTRPNASHLNVPAGVTQGNQVIVPLGADGRVAVFNHSGSTHVAADVAGYFFLDPLRLTA